MRTLTIWKRVNDVSTVTWLWGLIPSGIAAMAWGTVTSLSGRDWEYVILTSLAVLTAFSLISYVILDTLDRKGRFNILSPVPLTRLKGMVSGDQDYWHNGFDVLDFSAPQWRDSTQLLERLQKAAQDGTVRFYGRMWRDGIKKKTQARLVPLKLIPPDVFSHQTVNVDRFVFSSDNLTIGTVDIASGEFRSGESYVDLQVNRRQLRRWFKRQLSAH